MKEVAQNDSDVHRCLSSPQPRIRADLASTCAADHRYQSVTHSTQGFDVMNPRLYRLPAMCRAFDTFFSMAGSGRSSGADSEKKI